MNDTVVKETSIELRRVYAAPRARVWRAWTTPEGLREWYAPVDGWEVSRADVDLRRGGGYHLEFGPPGAPPIVETGTYVDVVENERLVVRIRLGTSNGTEDTELTVEFSEDAAGTLVVVREGGYSSHETAQKHARGWTYMLNSLSRLLAGD